MIKELWGILKQSSVEVELFLPLQQENVSDKDALFDEIAIK